MRILLHSSLKKPKKNFKYTEASIKNLENQIGKLSRQLVERTICYLEEEQNIGTIMSGEVLSSPISNELIILEIDDENEECMEGILEECFNEDKSQKDVVVRLDEKHDQHEEKIKDGVKHEEFPPPMSDDKLKNARIEFAKINYRSQHWPRLVTICVEHVMQPWSSRRKQDEEHFKVFDRGKQYITEKEKGRKYSSSFMPP